MAVSIKGRFRRSINLVRDFYDEHDLEGYVVTAKARELTGRITNALASAGVQRAWSVTGPYGGGKSAFALFLSHLLRGDASARALLAETDSALATRIEEIRGGAFCPVLVVGSREPLGPSLLKSLAKGLDAFAAQYERKPGRVSQAVKDTRKALTALAREADEAVRSGHETRALDLFEQAASAVHEATGGGLLIVVDELGKLLEYAALYPEQGDLFVLQRLAERTADSGSTEAPKAPILLFTILHQAFERYAGRLNAAQRDEWQKVQGRFEDVAFVEPVSETLRLLAQAIGVEHPERLPTHADALIEAAARYGTLPAATDPAWVRDQLRGALPLHPAVSLLVGPLFRRLAQNERSLFAFLASGEPHGVLDVLGRTDDLFATLPLYRLDHLYDYLIANLGTTLFSERMNRLWAETEAALASLPAPTPLQLRLLKHIALLGFAGQLAGLRPTPEVLAMTADAPTDEVEGALQALKQARVVTYRVFQDEYHVWQGSDFDLEAKLREAREHVPLRTPLAKLLTDTVPPTPVVARRHSYRTGTTRVFEVVYASDETWRAATEKPRTHTDGRLVYVLPDHDEPQQLLADLREELQDPLTLAAVPDGVAALREAVRDLACLDWVRAHADELKGDKVARRELTEQRTALAAEVERRLNRLFVADETGKNPCTWVYAEESFRLNGERAVQQKLSAICDEVFSQTPEVWNELLNRRKPSSSAVRGLKLLLDAMIHRDGEERLGIASTPAEYGMYASVLQATGIHRQDELGRWHFARPDEAKHPGCTAAWDAIADTLRSTDGQPVPIHDLYARLSAAPYGMRPGLIPVFLFAFYKYAEEEIAFYESGTFVRDLSFETVERLLKSQEKGRDSFTVQRVEIEGARAEVIATLAPLVGIAGTVRKPLPVVIRLLQRIHDLPPFVRSTATLAPTTLSVRETLQRATDPTALLFEDLPAACDAGSFLADTEPDAERVQRFADQLQEALRELGGAYAALLADLEDLLARTFRLRTTSADDRRHELAQRARTLLPATNDLRLKAFLVRATDEILDTQGWYESLAALLAKRPPAQWSDEDRTHFQAALRETAQAFFKLEPLADDLAQSPDAKVRRVRLFVKTLSEDEQDGLIHIHPEDDALVDRLYARVAEALSEEEGNAEVKLAALGKLIGELLSERSPTFANPERHE